MIQTGRNCILGNDLTRINLRMKRKSVHTLFDIVVDAMDGIFDNIPGKKNTRDIPGNYVVIDHLNGEFSMLAHLQKGSVLVRKGDEVRAGKPIGKCGNSGHSNLPHLNYHLQNTPLWLKGEGLPAQFRNYYANGKLVERGEPTQGQIISHVPITRMNAEQPDNQTTTNARNIR